MPHLANAAACLAVLIDSKLQGNMTDDRPPTQAALPALINDQLPNVTAALRVAFADRAPRHWTNADDAASQKAEPKALKCQKRCAKHARDARFRVGAIWSVRQTKLLLQFKT